MDTNTQPLLYRQLHNSLKHGRLFHAYLFVGEEVRETKKWGQWLMQGFFCENPQDGDPCLRCHNCLRIAENEHPDVLNITPEGTTIKVDQIRKLQDEFGKTGMETTKRGFFIEEAEKMSVSAANSLLKFLEEPQVDSLAIFTTDSLNRILPTIQSRLQVVTVTQENKATLKEEIQKELSLKEEELALLLEFTDSSQQAVELWNNQWFNEASKTVKTYVEKLVAKDWESFVFIQSQLTVTFKEKKQQDEGFALLFYHLKKSPLSRKEKSTLLEIFLQQKRKWQSNVTFQNSIEQGTLLYLMS